MHPLASGAARAGQLRSEIPSLRATHRLTLHTDPGVSVLREPRVADRYVGYP